MSLTNHQKLRLQQIGVPIWELRSDVEAVSEEPPISNNNQQSLKVIASSGDSPVVFFLCDEANHTSEVFINDVLIGLNQHHSDWQLLSGDKLLFNDFLATVAELQVAVFVSNQYQSVEFDDSKSGIKLYLPASPKNLVQFKKQLWSAIYQSCYH